MPADNNLAHRPGSGSHRLVVGTTSVDVTAVAVEGAAAVVSAEMPVVPSQLVRR